MPVEKRKLSELQTCTPSNPATGAPLVPLRSPLGNLTNVFVHRNTLALHPSDGQVAQLWIQRHGQQAYETQVSGKSQIPEKDLKLELETLNKALKATFISTVNDTARNTGFAPVGHSTPVGPTDLEREVHGIARDRVLDDRLGYSPYRNMDSC